jgi:uncharacterized protein (TIGR03437 family)
LYTANQTGQGPAAAQVVSAQGVYSGVSQCGSVGVCVPVPIDVTTSPYLVLYGTGIRAAAPTNVSVQMGNVAAPMLYAGPQATYAGLDQVNALLPSSLQGRRQLVVTVTVNGQAANMGELAFQ